MEPTTGHDVPGPQTCEQARLSRDPRFDGLFFTAVTSTRIYCRPVCPVPTVRSENVRYYSTAAAAEKAGYRPCLRCRPELSPGLWRRGDAALERALRLIDDGVLVDGSLASLARRVGLGERQLRRLFVERLGASPLRVHATRRLLFAKQLLTETRLPITQVALESGFQSLRRFNASFRGAYRMAPSDLRRRRRVPAGGAMVLTLTYRPPYDFDAMLGVIARRALPGIEIVDEGGYARSFGPADAPGWLRLARSPEREHALQLTLQCPASARILDVVTRLKRMFDLDADPRIIHATLARDAGLRRLLERHPGLRLSGTWDGFESSLRLLLEREGADRVAAFVRHAGTSLDDEGLPDGVDRLFPTPGSLGDAADDVFAKVGLTPRSVYLVRRVARACVDGTLDFRAPHTLDAFGAAWTAVTGDDGGDAQLVAMQALGHPDAFPAATLPGFGASAELAARSESWRPWRAYAVTLLARDREHGRAITAAVLSRYGAARLHHERRLA